MLKGHLQSFEFEIVYCHLPKYLGVAGHLKVGHVKNTPHKIRKKFIVSSNDNRSFNIFVCQY